MGVDVDMIGDDVVVIGNIVDGDGDVVVIGRDDVVVIIIVVVDDDGNIVDGIDDVMGVDVDMIGDDVVVIGRDDVVVVVVVVVGIGDVDVGGEL